MLTTFDDCYEAVLNREGGFKLHLVEDDSGGWTYGGLTERWFPDALDWHRLKEIGDQPEFRQAVKDAMKTNFWDRLKCDEMPEFARDAIYDFAVNAGPGTCAEILQEMADIHVDGVVGPVTVKAVHDNFDDDDHFHLLFFLHKHRHYVDLCNEDRSQTKFLLGWMNRMDDVWEAWEESK